MNKNEKQYLIKKYTPKSNIAKDMLLAFIFGGIICALGEGLVLLFSSFGIDDKTSSLLTTLSFIFIASLLTGFGIFDRIGRIAGAGTLVPVTGFSNSVTSEAMDSSSEGFILGVGAKIFTVAGPVILYGICSGVVYGIIYFLFGYISSLLS